MPTPGSLPSSSPSRFSWNPNDSVFWSFFFFFLIAFTSLSSLLQGGRALGAPFTPRTESVKRAEAILSKMTLEEKVGQLVQTYYGDAEEAERHKTIKAQIRKNQLGSFLGLKEPNLPSVPKAINELQKIALESSTHKIPLLFAFDVIHGFRTIFPIPLGEASSWDPSVAERAARVAALEARSNGIAWTFAPMMDVARDPRWGRVAEGTGEDPYLGQVFAAAHVRGFQGPNNDLRSSSSLLACAKHFAAYGAAEAGRDYNSTDMSEVTLRNVYLPPFHAAVEAGVGTLMAAFNSLNGVPSTGNDFIFNRILRKEWGFKGTVVSDWTSISELIPHGVVANLREAAAKVIRTGLDVDMSSSAYFNHLAHLVKSGTVPLRQLNESVKRVLILKLELGLFENPFVDEKKAKAAILTPENRKVALEVAQRSIVLLKNDKGLLPLKKNSLKSLALIGSLVGDRKAPMGGWSGFGLAQDVVSVEEGIRRKVGDRVELILARGAGTNGPTLPMDVMGNAVGPYGSKSYGKFSRDLISMDADRIKRTYYEQLALRKKEGKSISEEDPDWEEKGLIQEAVKVAKKAGLALVVVGEDEAMTAEAHSRTQLDLPGNQQSLLKALTQAEVPYVLVLMNGRPLTLTWEDQHAQAIVETWQLGVEAGNAIADVLFGDYNPGGKLPISFPRSVGQVPLYYNHLNTGRPTGGSDPLYWSHYLDVSNEPLYPFGYGLSYTQFKISDVKLNKKVFSKRASGQDEIIVSAQVANVGSLGGDEVVQVYVRDLVGSIARPVKELKAFERVTLKPGEKKGIQLRIKMGDLGFYNAQAKYVVEPGDFRLWVGNSSVDESQALDFRLTP